MKKRTLALLFVSLAFAQFASPQEKAAETKQERVDRQTPLRIQLLLTEFDGDKKIASMPYSFLVNSAEPGPLFHESTKIRDGVRVPVEKTNSGERTWTDIGTNIDCWAQPVTENRHKVTIRVDYSALIIDNNNARSLGVAADKSGLILPAVHQVTMEFSPVLKDGQPSEISTVTDPFNGHVFKVSVIATVVKQL